MDLLNIDRDNAAKILGVEMVKLPSSVRCIEETVKKTLESDTEKRVRADPAPPQVSVICANILIHNVRNH